MVVEWLASKSTVPASHAHRTSLNVDASSGNRDPFSSTNKLRRYFLCAGRNPQHFGSWLAHQPRRPLACRRRIAPSPRTSRHTLAQSTLANRSARTHTQRHTSPHRHAHRLLHHHRHRFTVRRNCFVGIRRRTAQTSRIFIVSVRC